MNDLRRLVRGSAGGSYSFISIWLTAFLDLIRYGNLRGNCPGSAGTVQEDPCPKEVDFSSSASHAVDTIKAFSNKTSEGTGG